MAAGARWRGWCAAKQRVERDLIPLCIVQFIVVFCTDGVLGVACWTGAPMGCAPMAFLLWSQVMNYNPANPKWVRFLRPQPLRCRV